MLASLPQEPGGYTGYQALFGHRYVAPQLGAGAPDVTHNGYQVTNAAGNLVDENGNQINGAFLNNHPGFPGFGPINASQTLAYVADMQEAGIPGSRRGTRWSAATRCPSSRPRASPAGT